MARQPSTHHRHFHSPSSCLCISLRIPGLVPSHFPVRVKRLRPGTSRALPGSTGIPMAPWPVSSVREELRLDRQRPREPELSAFLRVSQLCCILFGIHDPAIALPSEREPGQPTRGGVVVLMIYPWITNHPPNLAPWNSEHLPFQRWCGVGMQGGSARGLGSLHG